jgi:predicted DNA-binding transcriptional regulator YafY
MSRAERLLELMQCLRRHRYAVSGQALATELGISLRSLYRDIASLRAQGARIEGEPGMGYRLQPGFELPPLMFNSGEMEALLLGARWVSRSTDPALAKDAHNALARIAAVLPPALRHELDSCTLLIGPSTGPRRTGTQHLPALRQAIREQRKVRVVYQDEHGQPSDRVLWPFALGYMEQARLLVAWCELRGANRHFRVDRLQTVEVQASPYPTPRQRMLKQWLTEQGITLDTPADEN